jgi:hypothetical protein
MKLDQNDLVFLAGLAARPDGKMLLSLLKRRQAMHNQKLRTASPDKFQVAQGAAQECDDLIQWIEDAGERLAQQAPTRQVTWTGDRL